MKRLMAVSELSDQKVVASHREKVDQEVKVDLAVEEAGVEEHVDVVVVELEVDSQLESGNLSVGPSYKDHRVNEQVCCLLVCFFQ